MFYVYEWFVIETGEIFYVGKGTGRRFKVRKHNKFFNEFIKRNNCESRIVKTFEKEADAFAYEYDRVSELKNIGQCVCNINDGGFGGSTSWWNDEIREKYSKTNVMKSSEQRKRMSKNNPMKNADVAKRVRYAHRRKICIGDRVYSGLIEAANEYGVSPNTIHDWAKRGYSVDLLPCYYYGNEKPEVKIRSHNTTGKKIYVDDVLFQSIKEAAKYVGVGRSTLIAALNSNQLCKGHVCKYGNQQPRQGKFDNSTLQGSTTNG